MTGPFATATEFCEFVNIAMPTDLSRLQKLLRDASSLIRHHAGQMLSEVTDDEITIQPQYNLTTGLPNPLPAAFGARILLPERPVTAITEILTNSVAFTAFSFTAGGVLMRTDGQAWIYPAVITYDHGYPETSEEFAECRTICIQVASRAFTMNERSASEVLGSTLLESGGYSPEIFLTDGEKMRLQFGKAVVG